uniref:ER lumen protein-retaining receptor-like n=1 Tax=Dermatophagoides pteronyssinus TaxID=6956 RepID=A0A6P6XM68_DERPT|nr:ER lumen protein-retaining receptor-like [Dermatophagoides pteronyssinus]
MNIFRFTGDMLHLASSSLLIYKLLKTKNCAGISAKMQEIYLIVFSTRYLDLFYVYFSLYNTIMKFFFIFSTIYILYLIRFQKPISKSYDKQADNFNYLILLILPILFISYIFGQPKSIVKVLWRFSIWLESFALVPQIVLLQKYGVVENLTSHYVTTMGLYRTFYLINWIYRLLKENYCNYTGWIGGMIQVALYLDFFYYYFQARLNGWKMILPYANRI